MRRPTPPLPVTLIAAHGEDRAIGARGRLPWHLPDDLAHFRALTLGRVLILGRATQQGLGAALPGRVTVVLTRDPASAPAGTHGAASLEEALALAARFIGAGEAQGPDVLVAGGERVYRLALPHATRLERTLVHATFPEADAHFPDPGPGWTLRRHLHRRPDARHAHARTFQTLTRVWAP